MASLPGRPQCDAVLEAPRLQHPDAARADDHDAGDRLDYAATNCDHCDASERERTTLEYEWSLFWCVRRPKKTISYA